MYGEEMKYNAVSVSGTGMSSVSTLNLPETQDVPRVSREMTTIQKLLAEHAETASLVEQRLHSVLRPTEPEKVGGEVKEPRPASSPMTCDLEAFRYQLVRTLEHYNNILSRLEI